MTARLAIVLALACLSLGATRYYSCGPRRMAASAGGAPEITPGYNNMLVWWKITTNDANGGYVKDWSPSGVNYGTQDTAAAQFVVTNLDGVLCAYLDGGDYSSTTNTALLNGSSNMTLAVWVNQSVEVSWGAILAVRCSQNTLNSLTCVNNSSVGIIGSLPDYTPYPLITTGYQNTWMHVALTYNGQTMAIYTNGILAGSAGKTGTLFVDDAWHLGWDDADPGRKWNGYLDDARIYNRCLTSNEIWTVSQEAR